VHSSGEADTAIAVFEEAPSASTEYDESTGKQRSGACIINNPSYIRPMNVMMQFNAELGLTARVTDFTVSAAAVMQSSINGAAYANTLLNIFDGPYGVDVAPATDRTHTRHYQSDVHQAAGGGGVVIGIRPAFIYFASANLFGFIVIAHMEAQAIGVTE
jgi:hypothetical protein